MVNTGVIQQDKEYYFELTDYEVDLQERVDLFLQSFGIENGTCYEDEARSWVNDGKLDIRETIQMGFFDWEDIVAELVSGDLICDTPADPGPANIDLTSYNQGWDLTAGCVMDGCQTVACVTDENGDEYQPDVRNIMGAYYGCRETFSDEQVQIMLCSLENDFASILLTEKPESVLPEKDLITVGCDDESESNLQTALLEVTLDGTVEICSGTYHENLWVIGGSMTLRARDGQRVILDGGNIKSVIQISGNAFLTIENVTLQNGRAQYGGGGIDMKKSHVVLRGVTVTENSSDQSGPGIRAVFSSLELYGTNISGNYVGKKKSVKELAASYTRVIYDKRSSFHGLICSGPGECESIRQ